MVTVIGIDCAVQEKDVGLVRTEWNGHRTEVTELAKGGQVLAVVEIIREWIGDSTTTLLALDAPLVWPKPFGEQLFQYKAGVPMTVLALDDSLDDSALIVPCSVFPCESMGRW